MYIGGYFDVEDLLLVWEDVVFCVFEEVFVCFLVLFVLWEKCGGEKLLKGYIFYWKWY